MMAHPAADPWEGMVLFEQFQCFQIFPGLDKGNESLDAYMCRTGDLTGSRPSFLDGKSTWNRLGVLFEGSSLF